MARTDAMHTAGFAEGVARANLYLEAGAEMVMIFPDTEQEARQAPREIKGPLAYTNSEAAPAASVILGPGIRGDRIQAFHLSHGVAVSGDAGAEARHHEPPQQESPATTMKR